MYNTDAKRWIEIKKLAYSLTFTPKLSIQANLSPLHNSSCLANAPQKTVLANTHTQKKNL